jgi:hypothetical protein
MTTEYTIDFEIDFDDDFRLNNNNTFFSKKYRIEADNELEFDKALLNLIKEDLKEDRFAYVSPSKSIDYLIDVIKNLLENNDLLNDKTISYGGNYEMDINVLNEKPVKENKKRRFLNV